MKKIFAYICAFAAGLGVCSVLHAEHGGGDIIFGDAKIEFSDAIIDQILGNAIYWKRGSEDFEKWEISDDFTEIKEYRKDGEEWVLQAAMKKAD